MRKSKILIESNWILVEGAHWLLIALFSNELSEKFRSTGNIPLECYKERLEELVKLKRSSVLFYLISFL